MKNLMTLLHEYEKSSVQLISQGKSGFNLHDKFQRRALIIARATVLNQKALPFIYLELPIFLWENESHVFRTLD